VFLRFFILRNIQDSLDFLEILLGENAGKLPFSGKGHIQRTKLLPLSGHCGRFRSGRCMSFGRAAKEAREA
jgi:hypothetical protein